MPQVLFNKTKKMFHDAMFDLLMLHSKGFKHSGMYRDVYEDFTTVSTIFITPDVEESGGILCNNTPIVKRFSTYRGNFESVIQVNDIISEYDVYCDIHVSPKQSELNQILERIEISPDLYNIFTDGVCYFDKTIDMFIPGFYGVTVAVDDVFVNLELEIYEVDKVMYGKLNNLINK